MIDPQARPGPYIKLMALMALVAALTSPLFAGLITLTLVQKETAPPIAVAVVISALLTALLELRAARNAVELAPSPAETEQAEIEQLVGAGAVTR